MNAGLAKPIPQVLVYSEVSLDMPQKYLLQCAACVFAGPRDTPSRPLSFAAVHNRHLNEPRLRLSAQLNPLVF